MSEFSYTELEAAHKALRSSHNKIEKALGTLSQKQPPPKAQITLATRNLDALRIAISLVTDEMEKSDMGAFAADTGRTAALRLTAYEGLYNELANSMVTIPVELEKLKAAGKEKTVRYRELFGQKLINGQIAAMFERHGFSFDETEQNHEQV